MIHISVLSGSLSDIISSTNLPIACFCMRTLQINTDVKHVPCVTCRGRSKSRSGGRRGRTATVEMDSVVSHAPKHNNKSLSRFLSKCYCPKAETVKCFHWICRGRKSLQCVWARLVGRVTSTNQQTTSRTDASTTALWGTSRGRRGDLVLL